MANGNRKGAKNSQAHFRKKSLDNHKQKLGIMVDTAHVTALQKKNKKNSCKDQEFKERNECAKTRVKITKPMKKTSELAHKLGTTPCTVDNTTAENGREISKQVLTSHGESKNNDDKERMRKKSRKKRTKQDGATNWLNLCSTLNIAVPKKSKKSTKRQAETKLPDPETKRAKSEIWFDNVDEILIESAPPSVDLTTAPGTTGKAVPSSITDPSGKLVKPESFPGMTNCVAMDCEMVGTGPKGDESILARVSVVNHFGVCLYDKFVLPREKVTDYRTFVSGVTAENLATGEDFLKVQEEVSSILKGRVLVGHAVHNDLRVLFLTHPHKDIRDTSQFKPFRELFGGRSPSLKKLTDRLLGVRVQEGQHSSVQDAQATMRLYTMHRQRWEKELRAKRNSIKGKRTHKKKKKKKTEAAN